MRMVLSKAMVPGRKDYCRLQKGQVKILVKDRSQEKDLLHSLLFLYGAERKATGYKGHVRLSTHSRACHKCTLPEGQ